MQNTKNPMDSINSPKNKFGKTYEWEVPMVKAKIIEIAVKICPIFETIVENVVVFSESTSLFFMQHIYPKNILTIMEINKYKTVENNLPKNPDSIELFNPIIRTNT